MEPFKNLTSKVVPLDIANIDTDQIIPKQFLKLLGKTGYGEYLSAGAILFLGRLAKIAGYPVAATSTRLSKNA